MQVSVSTNWAYRASPLSSRIHGKKHTAEIRRRGLGRRRLRKAIPTASYASYYGVAPHLE